MSRKLGFMILLFVCQLVVRGQAETESHLYTGFQANYGFIIPHSTLIEPISHTNPYGFETIFDGYIRETIERAGTELDYKRLSVTAGEDFQFGKLLFSQHLGVYVYSPYKARNYVYQKYEFAYKISSCMEAGVFLKAHLQVAELMGLNLSWTISEERRTR